MTNVIDRWVNVIDPSFEPPFDPTIQVALKKRFPNFLANAQRYSDGGAMLALMDNAGVSKAVLSDPLFGHSS